MVKPKNQKTEKRGERPKKKFAPRDPREVQKKTFDKESWKPRTGIGLKVKKGEITNIDEILDAGDKILEPEIVDVLLPDANSDLLMVGQAKGKFGGGQRRVFRQTQKKTNEGNKPSFATFVVLGNNNGYVGIGYGKSRETVPAREKAIRNSKLNVMKIRRGCGSWQCGCNEPHTIPYNIEGKCGSVKLKLMPAPKGTGLCVEKECQKILAAAGIKDVWSHAAGQTRTKINLLKACIDALSNLSFTKVHTNHFKILGIADGAVTKKEEEKEPEVIAEAIVEKKDE
ncbi:MAG: 30S ribosomal protein S5 [bacterium]|nr:30S ribosomal protein S5 [bacterium]